MHTLIEMPDLTIVHDPALHWLYLTWRGRHSEQESKECCLLVLRQVRLTRSTKILNDATHDLDGWSQLTQWISQEFMQHLANSGVVAIGWVVPRDLRARLDVEKVLSHQSRPLTDAFTDIEAAHTWLRNLR